MVSLWPFHQGPSDPFPGNFKMKPGHLNQSVLLFHSSIMLLPDFSIRSFPLPEWWLESDPGSPALWDFPKHFWDFHYLPSPGNQGRECLLRVLQPLNCTLLLPTAKMSSPVGQEASQTSASILPTPLNCQALALDKESKPWRHFWSLYFKKFCLVINKTKPKPTLAPDSPLWIAWPDFGSQEARICLFAFCN